VADAYPRGTDAHREPLDWTVRKACASLGSAVCVAFGDRREAATWKVAVQDRRPASLPVIACGGRRLCSCLRRRKLFNLQMPPGGDVTLPNLPRGEELCTAYEGYKARSPSSSLTIEQALLVLTALARGDELALTHCPRCSAPILLDRLSTRHPRCHHCSSKLAPTQEMWPSYTTAEPASHRGQSCDLEPHPSDIK